MFGTQEAIGLTSGQVKEARFWQAAIFPDYLQPQLEAEAAQSSSQAAQSSPTQQPHLAQPDGEES